VNMTNNIFSISAFVYGLPVGFAFSFALGPVFFSLLKASLEHGFRSAVYIAMGVVLADMVLLGIAYGGIEAFLPTHIDVAFWVQLFGGLLLLVIGIATMTKKVQNTEGVLVRPSHLFIKNIARGFLINILNPVNFFEWVGAAGVLKSKYHFAVFENISFFTGALLAVFLTELLVAYFASRLKNVLTPRIMTIFNVIMGAVFLGFGVWLLWEAAH
jgi:threonine/homoserine/homoserine lactone efflux protein